MDDSNASALVDAALRHDEGAARALVRQLYPLVAKVVRAHRPRRTAEEDLCQMIFIKVFQKLSQFSGKVQLEHWVSRIAVNTCLNQIELEKVRPELRYADLSHEEQAVVENLATSSDELAPDQRLASRQLVEHLLGPLKPVERSRSICYICRDVPLRRFAKSPAGAQRSLRYGPFERGKK